MVVDPSPSEARRNIEGKVNSVNLDDLPSHVKSSVVVQRLVKENKHVDASIYLFALRRVSMNEWLKTTNLLLRMVGNQAILNTYATLIEISMGNPIEEKAHLLPGLSQSIIGKSAMPYEACLEFMKEINSAYDI